MFKKEIEIGKFILHSCDNEKCVNPDHLREGDHIENMQDKVSRGRLHDQSGIKNPIAKLNWQKVRKIRKLYKTKKYTQKEIGQIFNIYADHVSRICNNKIWKE